ncbi:hypothetical protein NPIL_610831 [Nephila pilipes]|uniref:Uncharacterized protein n=1 Tax=Nephila pilipes TaxID=299642 RepID=A0A8X6IQ59_NEPPI|nr:hypothetical protein NPIL_610831 [Nephila pilipes]
MSKEKKWHEYARPIPFDEHHRRIQQDRIYAENKIRRQWENKYGKTKYNLDLDKVCLQSSGLIDKKKIERGCQPGKITGSAPKIVANQIHQVKFYNEFN